MSIPDMNDALQPIVRLLHDECVEAGAQSVRYNIAALGWKRKKMAWVRFEDGDLASLKLRVPAELTQKLRDSSTSPVTGTWFTAAIEVSSEGKVTTDFDYDGEPDFHPLDILSEDIEDELKWWPRSDENLPKWFKEKMIEFGIVNSQSDGH